MWKHSLENHHKGNVIQKQNAYNIQTAHQDKRKCCDHRKRISLWSVCPIIKQQEEGNTHPIDVRKEIWLTKNCSEMIQLHGSILLHSSVPLPDQLALAFIRIMIFWNFFLVIHIRLCVPTTEMFGWNTLNLSFRAIPFLKKDFGLQKFFHFTLILDRDIEA